MTAKTTATKAPNYTPEQTLDIVTTYVANKTKETIETLAVKHAKTVKSIVAKLSREGVYEKAGYVNKAGEKPAPKKDDTADAIGAILGLTENDTSSLAKANKVALAKVFAALAQSTPLVTPTEAHMVQASIVAREVFDSPLSPDELKALALLPERVLIGLASGLGFDA